MSRRAHDITRSNEALRNGAVHLEHDDDAGPCALDAEITPQAMIIAYIDDYKFMMLIALAAMPIVFLLRKSGPGADAGHAVLE